MLASQVQAGEVNKRTERGRQAGKPVRVESNTPRVSNGTSRSNNHTAHQRSNNLGHHTAHERSHQRSSSAQPVLSSPRQEKTDVADVKDGIARHLKNQFDDYSKLGDRRSDGSHITCSQSDKWLKQVL